MDVIWKELLSHQSRSLSSVPSSWVGRKNLVLERLHSLCKHLELLELGLDPFSVGCCLLGLGDDSG